MNSSVTSKGSAENGKSKRLFYLDFLRAVACVCVVIIHSSAHFLEKDFGSFNFWVGDAFDSLARMAIPLFVMISGAVFLDENYNCTPKKMFHHILRMVIFYVFWSTGYSLIFNLVIPLLKHNPVYFTSILKSAVLGHWHTWFCFMIVGLYLIVPLLRLWVKKENVKQVRYFIVLAAVFAMFLPSTLNFVSLLFPKISPLSSILGYVDLSYVGGYTVYFILGWYLNNYEIKYKKTLVVLGFIGVLISTVGTAILSISLNGAYQFYGNSSLHVALPSCAVFILCRGKYKDSAPQNSGFGKIVTLISKYSLGIYAIHAFFIYVAEHLLPRMGVTNALLYVPLSTVFVFAISLLASFTASKIPLLKKIV